MSLAKLQEIEAEWKHAAGYVASWSAAAAMKPVGDAYIPALCRALRAALEGLTCRCDEIRMGSDALCYPCRARAAALAELSK